MGKLDSVFGAIVLLAMICNILSFSPLMPSNPKLNKAFKMSFDVPLIPAVVLTTLGVFAVFNIDNKVDLTDAGIAAAKKKERREREARGDLRRPDPNADPYRYKWFEIDDTEDVDFINKPKGGGCG